MIKYGLKLWSNNETYVPQAKRLYKKKIYNYIELYIVPGTYDKYIKVWHSLDIPFIIHCTHSIHGFNLAIKNKSRDNLKIFHEVKTFCDRLNAEYIIFHPGVKGTPEESIRQIKNIYDKRLLIENKPYLSMYGDRCRGSVYTELRRIITSSGVGFCLDAAHAINTAFNLSVDAADYIKKMVALSPEVIHLSDGKMKARHDKHLHIGDGDFKFKKIIRILLDSGAEYFTIETSKDSDELDDFIKDVEKIRDMAKA